ncbi:hypothetical protein BDQ12DRAFT_733136 [Crucibulum laeve]|uniref:SET domain-containing protein n=1 Tax=Crucibulum laeve TaxID=68775 RepID=A0A5C3MKG8_9AGAR|nr:hypothetical protein BDQ12DRAFT_733136 [Crucibulum laeve]
MSDFAKLKATRKSREAKKSYMSAVSNATNVALNNHCTLERSDDQAEAIILSNDDSGMQVDTAEAISTYPIASNAAPASTPESSVTISDQAMDVDVSSGELVDRAGFYNNAILSNLEVRMSTEEGKGRGIWSKAPWRPGDVLISVKPHVAALSNQNLETHCSSCFGPGEALKRCQSCKVVHYCDSKCQNADWSMHKHECPALKRWAAAAPSSSDASSSVAVPSDAVRCLGRILWRKQKLGHESIWTREIQALQSHRISLSKAVDDQHSQLHTHLAHALVRYLGLTSPEGLAEYGLHSAADLVDLVSRFTTNTFTLTSPNLTPLGACVSPAIALINHSCDPNAVIVFPRAGGEAKKDEEPRMQVIALKYITPNEEILTSYIDTTLPRTLRQATLRETYHFTCHCSLCSHSPRPVDHREAMYCPRKCSGLCSVPTEEDPLTRCTKCKSPVKDTDTVLDALRVGQEALEKAERLQFSDPKKACQLTTNLIPILTSAGLFPSTHPLLALSRLHTSLLITALPSTNPAAAIEEISSPQVQEQSGIAEVTEQESATSPTFAQQKLDEAIRASTRSNAGLSEVLQYGHPVRGIALAELGKLLSVDEPAPKDVKGPDTSPSTENTAPNLTPLLPGSASPNPMYPPSGPQRVRLAYETLARARNELLIGFGRGKNEGGEVGQEVRHLVVELEKEIGVWKTGIRNVMQSMPRTK